MSFHSTVCNPAPQPWRGPRVRFSRLTTSRNPTRKLEEYHPRQWVDRSGAAYRGRTSRLRPRIPPTAVGGSFKFSLQRSVQGFSFFICPSVAPQGRAMTKQRAAPALFVGWTRTIHPLTWVG